MSQSTTLDFHQAVLISVFRAGYEANVARLCSLLSASCLFMLSDALWFEYHCNLMKMFCLWPGRVEHYRVNSEGPHPILGKTWFSGLDWRERR